MISNRGTSWLVTIHHDDEVRHPYPGEDTPRTKTKLVVVIAQSLTEVEKVVREGLNRDAIYSFEITTVQRIADTTYGEEL